MLSDSNNSISNIEIFNNMRFLPKLHKKKFGIRPIINCRNTVTSVIASVIDFILKPLASSQPSFLKDSQNLIQLTCNLKYNSHSKLYTADFESLYQNIPLDEAIIIISDIIKKYHYDHFTTFGFYSLLKFLLKNNYFYFKSFNNLYYFLQVLGIAMGIIWMNHIFQTYFRI